MKRKSKSVPSKKKATPASVPVAYDDGDWRARDDARTLASAAAIKRDADRMKKAAEAAKKMVVEEKKAADEARIRANAISRLAGNGREK